MNQDSGLIADLLALPIFETEWVLWALFGLSVLTVAVMIERAIFFRRSAIDIRYTRRHLDELLAAGDFAGAAELLGRRDALETNVALAGLVHYRRGAESVEALIEGAEAAESRRYRRGLGTLATIGSNAPFIGLFGTVLGIIKAFQELSAGSGAAGAGVMSGIAEALVATAVGLFVAIPALIAFNVFTSRLKQRSGDAATLSRTLLSHLKSEHALAEAA
jgi:biopolymer transport protein ExbB/TolQ